MKRKQYTKSILSNLHELDSRRFLGDTYASETLIDLQRAINLAELTDKQRRILDLMYFQDLTQKQAAEVLGYNRSRISQLLTEIFAEIDEVYEAWAWQDGELEYDTLDELEVS